jgi:hypothetical protein
VFVSLFLGAGRDLDARSNAGLSLLETIREHRHGAAFRDILENANQGA